MTFVNEVAYVEVARMSSELIQILITGDIRIGQMAISSVYTDTYVIGQPTNRTKPILIPARVLHS